MQRIQEITGYPLDKTQRLALQSIVDGKDVLATLPTGSGKTVIALTAIILNAFDKGHRAILTTPVKALSNQKYAEFSKWFGDMFPKRITLLTGDIQARATPPGGDGEPELLIMTSEILANKLDSFQRTNELDPDLANVSVLVIDEAHYINDTERGHVWERTVMYLPNTIQIVALSATLSDPHRFQEWLSRRRPTDLVQRHDRHVPLHFGFYDKSFVELYSTRNEHKILDSSLYKKLAPQQGTFAQAITKIVTILEKDQKLPAIVFLMSKVKCEEAANCLTRNFLYGPPPKMEKGDDPLAFGEIQTEHQFAVTSIRRRQDDLFQQYLYPYKAMLATLPGFEAFKSLLDKGIAYHHAGMIPILREYVEILFAEKLLKVVFATETLAIGINMPAKCVVFTSLEKPGGKSGEMVSLRPEQFMQMSGRAGRRGMDEKGFVVYYPIRTCLTEAEFRHLLFGKMPSAQSQLSISPLFVLKHLQSTETNVLEKTLLHHQHQRYIKTLQAELDKLPVVPPELVEKVQKYGSLKDKMNGMFKLTQSQRKECDREITALAMDDATIKHVTDRVKLEKEIGQQESALSNNWKTSIDWLHEHGYIESDENRLTLIGKMSSGLSDGLPLVRGVMIERLKDASFEKFTGWLGCFTESIRVSNEAVIDQETLDEMNPILDEIQQTTEAYRYENDETLNDDQYNTGLLLYLWTTHKDMNQIYGYIGSGQLGTFIKAVLRVISYMEEIKKVLLGLQYYELYNRLDHHQDRLMDGLVTNRSLYVG